MLNSLHVSNNINNSDFKWKMSLASLSEPSHTPIINSHGEGKHLRPDRNTTPMWDMFVHF